MGRYVLVQRDETTGSEGHLDSATYVDMLEEYLKAFMREHYHKGNVFKQGGAPAHRAKRTTEFFVESPFRDIELPAKSPDLNCIINIWDVLVERVYEVGRG